MLLRMVTGFLLLVISTSVLALTEARILNVSSSKQTVVLNLGRQDKLFQEGEHAVLVKNIQDINSKTLRAVPVARAKNIALHSKNSIWVLYKVYDLRHVVKGEKYLFFNESAVLKGRRERTTQRTTLVAPKGQVATTAKSYLNDDVDRLAKKKNEYVEIGRNHGPENRIDADVELIDLEEWEKNKGTRYRSALYKSPHKEEFKRNLNLATFDKLVAGYLKKVNDPNFNYEQFYEDQMREDFANEFRKKPSVPTEYEEYRQMEVLQAEQDAKVYRNLLEKGEQWSEDFSDEELRKTLNRVSVLQEKDRRKLVVSKPKSFSAYFEYGYPLNDAQTDREGTERRSSRYSLETGLEYLPIIKHPTLERFTLDFSGRMNKSGLETNGTNATVDEFSLALGANWYPFYSAYTIEAPVIYLGTYLRSGFTKLQLPAGEKGNYTVLSLPGFRAGVRYILRNNFGVRISGSLETMRLSQYQSSKLEGTLPDSTTLVESKVGVGLTYSF